MRLLLGHDRETKEPVYVPLGALRRHLHFVGYTGAGKTTAILTLLTQLLPLPLHRRCVIVVDRLGGFSHDLLRWFASPCCPAWLRRRLVYIEGAREDAVVPMNPLLYRTPGQGYFRTARASEIVLRGWASQDLSQMPRLARWLFNSFWAAAQLGLTIADCVHFLRPRSPLHRPLLGVLPGSLRWEWEQILAARGGQAEVQLESARNRLTPFFEAPSLRAMFSSERSYLDVARWMTEQRVVLINLAPMGVLPESMADIIGGLVVNEVFAVARSLPPEARHETLLVLDEFQRFVGPDLELGIAECRQLRIELLLSHQSLSQLERGDTDLTSLILQAQSRLVLHVEGEDAEVFGQEHAAFTFDPLRVKDEIWHRCQRVSGHRIIELQSRSSAEQLARQWSENHGGQTGTSENWADGRKVGEAKTKGDTSGKAEGGTRGTTETAGTHQALQPEYEEFLQLASRQYVSFEEQRQEWGRRLRRLKTGEALWHPVNGDRLHALRVANWAVGHLGLEWRVVLKRLPQVVEAYERLLSDNLAQDCFVPPSRIERETRARLERVLQQRVVAAAAGDRADAADGGAYGV